MINDFYWFSRSRAMVDNAITSREEAAGKLVTAVGWFWTVYSTTAIIGTAISDIIMPWPLTVALVLPTIFLLLAYLLGLHVIIPHDGRFDPRSPTEIEEAYQAVLQLKRRRLKVAVIATTLAAGTVVAAILVASTSAPESTTTSFLAHYESKGEHGVLVVTGRLPGVGEALLSAEPRDDAAREGTMRSLETVSRSGEFHRSLVVPPAKSYDVKVEWKKGTETRSISRTVAPDGA